MSSPAAFKRRKLNDSSKTLTKPFVSPLKTAKADRVPLKEHNNAANLPYQPSTLAHTISATAQPSTTPTAANTLSSITTKSTPIRKSHVFTISSKRTDPTEIAAQKALTSLELQIRHIRNEIDTLKQAAQISSSTIDQDLEELASKWKAASQSATEEVFATVKERVCRMGGVAAWKESEQKKYDRSHGLGEFAEEPEKDDDADCEFDSQGEELPDEEQEYRKREKARMRQEIRDAADVEKPQDEERVAEGKKKVWQESGNDDDSFTIDMMLRSLNIDLDLVGYDKVAQRWIN